jgi:amidophosphoribosyltransferase
MAKLGDFIAFRAAIALLKESGRDPIIDDVYEKCQAQQHLPDAEIQNFVKDIYAPFTPEQISDKIAELLTPSDMKAEVKIIFQRIEDLHEACPNNLGDWYFTGNFPTAGGMRVVNRAFLNFYEGKNVRAY